MRISKKYKLDALGVIIVALPTKRDREAATEATAFSREVGGIIAKAPVELNPEDTCQHPGVFFSNDALTIARGEMDKDGEAVVIPLTESKAKTLDAEFELHRPEPKENQVPTIAALKNCFPEELDEPVLALDPATLKKAADAIGAKQVAIFKTKENLLLIKDAKCYEQRRTGEAIMKAAHIEGELNLQ